MKNLKNLFALTLYSITQIANATETTQTYHLECAKYTRTYVSKTYISYNEEQNYLSFNFIYEYNINPISPDETNKVFRNYSGGNYPIVSSVLVTNSKDDLLIEAASQVAGGRNPHHQNFELFLAKYGENDFYARKLILNSTDFSNYIGSCSFVSP